MVNIKSQYVIFRELERDEGSRKGPYNLKFIFIIFKI